MKVNKLALISMLAGGILTFSPAARSADDKPADSKPVKARSARGERLQQVAEQLKLTDEQKEKLKPIFQEEAKKLRELRNDKDLSRQDRITRIREIREDLNGKIKPVLTAEQLETWNKIRTERPRRLKQQ